MMRGTIVFCLGGSFESSERPNINPRRFGAAVDEGVRDKRDSDDYSNKP
jgi:hypothetical protein